MTLIQIWEIQYSRRHLPGINKWILQSFLLLICLSSSVSPADNNFRVFPYLQNPSPTAMTIVWFSETNTSGKLSYKAQGSLLQKQETSQPKQADALKYSTWEDTTYFANGAPTPPYRHRIRIEGLKPGKQYLYTVYQGQDRFNASFQTTPEGNVPVRFIVYGDSETEPESTGKHAIWTDPLSNIDRKYLIDQTQKFWAKNDSSC